MWWSHSVEYFRSLDTVKVVAGFTERITNKRVYFCFLKFRNKSHYSIVKDRWPWTLLGHKGMFGCKHCILSWEVAYWVCDSWPFIELVILAWLSVHNTVECFCLVATADVCYVGVLLSLTLFQAEGFSPGNFMYKDKVERGLVVCWLLLNRSCCCLLPTVMWNMSAVVLSCLIHLYNEVNLEFLG